MTVEELIEALKLWPDQQARVVFTYASEIDGDICVAEVDELKARKVEIHSGVLQEAAGFGAREIEVVELL